MVTFVPRSKQPVAEQAPAYWFLFQDDKLLLHPAGEGLALPLAQDVAALGVSPVHHDYLGYLVADHARCIDCYAGEIASDAALPTDLVASGLREAGAQLDDVLFRVAGRAVQVLAWARTNRYCGRCGTAMVREAHERAMRCPECGFIGYPVLAPAIIIAVVRQTEQGPRLLLARNHRFPPGRYSVLAGYVEPGETLEECAYREVLEEVGVRIKNIRYFASQPWPFPHSLMLGFTAEYDGGEIVLEQEEIADAGWFAADELPSVPPKITIARRLIDWFVAGSRKPEAGS